MTTPIVPSISDEQLAELEEAATDSKLNIYRPFGWEHSVRCGNHMQTDQDFLCASSPQTILSLIARLRAAEADAERLNKLDALCEAYGFEGTHEGNRWMIDGPYRDIRAAIDDIPENRP